MSDYVKSCNECQKESPIRKYRSTLRPPVSSLFYVLSVDFSGTFSVTSSGNCVVLGAVENLTGWPIAMNTAESTAQVILNFVKKEMLYYCRSPYTIASNYATSFTAFAVANVMARHGITWRTFLAYFPLSNCRAERMVGILKAAVRKKVLKTGMAWDGAFTEVL